MTYEGIAIAIDGPAAAGKSTVAKKIANKLNYLYIDTGAMYRAITLKALDHQIDVNDEMSLYQLLLKTTIELVQSDQKQRVYVNDEDVTDEIRSERVTNHVSKVAKHRKIREEMVKRQREYREENNVVMDGRDIGSHVLPDAAVKIFLVASVDERANRRYQENIKKDYSTNLEQLKEEIARRDQIDMEREVSPLVKSADAIELDTTSLSIDQVVDKILDIIDSKGVR